MLTCSHVTNVDAKNMAQILTKYRKLHVAMTTDGLLLAWQHEGSKKRPGFNTITEKQGSIPEKGQIVKVVIVGVIRSLWQPFRNIYIPSFLVWMCTTQQKFSSYQ